jgi:hypothetical protein
MNSGRCSQKNNSPTWKTAQICYLPETNFSSRRGKFLLTGDKNFLLPRHNKNARTLLKVEKTWNIETLS